MAESQKGFRKRPADGEEPELVKLRAFAECGFHLWYERVPKDFLAGRVADLVVRWQAIGANVPQLVQAMVEQLKIPIQPERVLDLIVAWRTLLTGDMNLKRGYFCCCIIPD